MRCCKYYLASQPVKDGGIPCAWAVENTRKKSTKESIICKNKVHERFELYYWQVCTSLKIQKLVSLWGSMASGLTLTLVRDIFVAMNDNHDDRKIIDMEKNNGPLYGRRAKNCRSSFCMFMSVGFCPSSFKFFLLRTATSRTS